MNITSVRNSMKKALLFLTLLMVIQISYSQKPVQNDADYYMSLKSFRNLATDTINIKYIKYIVRNGDTLVPYSSSVVENEDLIRTKYILKDTTFLNIYKSIAYRATGNYDPQHRFWKNDIIIFFGESVPRKHRRFLMNFIKENLGDVKNLNISKTRKLEDSNFIIYYDGDFEYENKFEGDYSNRINYQTNWISNRIVKSRIKMIPEFFNNEELLLSELLRTFVINLGYFNNSKTLGCRSIFSNCMEPIQKLSAIDLEIIKYHYSYGFCVGMNLGSFMEQDDMAREFYRLNPGRDYFVLFRKDDLKKD